MTQEQPPRVFRVGEPIERGSFSRGDLGVFVLLVALLYGGIRLALGAPPEVAGPTISLLPRVLPLYAGLSLGRMVAAYALSMLFTLVFGYWAAYEAFYRWSSILRAVRTKPALTDRLRHLMYSAGWKKLEGLWNVAIKLGALPRMLPLLESLLAGFGRYATARQEKGTGYFSQTVGRTTHRPEREKLPVPLFRK